jgi:hypothetical protein
VGGVTATSPAPETILLVPYVTALSPKAAIAGSPFMLTVTASNLTETNFSFSPPLPITSTVINASGTSATLTVSPAASAKGYYTLIGTNPAGTSSAIPIVGFLPTVTAFNTISIPGSSPTADPDADGLTNAQEIALGTDPLNPDTDGDTYVDGLEVLDGSDPLNPRSIPVIPTPREIESVAFTALNAPVTGAGTAGITETESVAFSLLNAAVTSAGTAGITETESVAFSLLNAAVTSAGTAGITETESVAFSLLNAPVTSAGTAGITETESVAFSLLNAPLTSTGTAGITETESVAFSLLNAPSASAGITETESYFSLLNSLPSGSSRQPISSSAGPGAVLGDAGSSQGSGTAAAALTPLDPFADSDGDGLPDWYELTIGTDPRNADSDGDGLSDFEELFIYRTNPLDPDTDGDGFSDGVEIQFGSDPLNGASTPLNPQPRREIARTNEGKGNANGQSQKPNQRKRSSVGLVIRRAGLLLSFRGSNRSIQ